MQQFPQTLGSVLLNSEQPPISKWPGLRQVTLKPHLVPCEVGVEVPSSSGVVHVT